MFFYFRKIVILRHSIEAYIALNSQQMEQKPIKLSKIHANESCALSVMNSNVGELGRREKLQSFLNGFTN